MGVLFLVMLAAGVSTDCGKLSGAGLRDQCYLNQSIAAPDEFDCVKLVTQTDMNVCSFRDYLRSDIELNRVWSQLTSRYRGKGKGAKPEPQSEFGLLLDAQRAWLSYREKQCDGEGMRYEGGSMRALVENSCREKVTLQRIDELKHLLEDN